MNDLHGRLSALADDLAPDADPHAQVAGARAQHRRQRRNRFGIAGAAAAVAAVAIGVPTVVNLLSAPAGDDVATPPPTSPVEGPAALPSEGPEGAAEDLRQFVDAMRAGLSRLGVDGTLPDPEVRLPCPDAAEALGRATGIFEVKPDGINAGRGTLTGCAWSTDETGSTPAEQRLDLSLHAASGATTESVLRELDGRVAEDGCSWATVLDDDAFDPLMRCEGSQNTWTLTLVDEDGTGAWVLTSAVGSELPEAFGTGTGTLAELWRIVEDGLATTPADPGTPSDPSIAFDDGVAEAEAMAAKIAELSPALSLGAPRDGAGCPDVVLFGHDGDLLQPGDPVTTGCVWSQGAGTSAVSASMRYYPELPPVRAILCPAAPVPGWSPAVEVEKACGSHRSGGWELKVQDADGAGGWVFYVAEDTEKLLPGLVQLADQIW